MKTYMHVETGSTDYKDGWILHYSSYELGHRGIDAATAFDQDVEDGRLVEVCGKCEQAEVEADGLCKDCRPKRCIECGMRDISENDPADGYGLCDECYGYLSSHRIQDEFIGYRKGE